MSQRLVFQESRSSLHRGSYFRHSFDVCHTCCNWFRSPPSCFCQQFAAQYAALNFLNLEHNGKAVRLVKRELSPGLAHNAPGARTQPDSECVFPSKRITFVMKLARRKMKAIGSQWCAHFVGCKGFQICPTRSENSSASSCQNVDTSATWF